MKAPFGRLAYSMAVLAVAGYAVVTLCGPRGLKAFLDKQNEIRQLETHNASLAKEIERKREFIKRLSADPSQQELEIRERLRLVHPRDKVFIIEPHGEPHGK